MNTSITQLSGCPDSLRNREHPVDGSGGGASDDTCVVEGVRQAVASSLLDAQPQELLQAIPTPSRKLLSAATAPTSRMPRDAPARARNLSGGTVLAAPVNHSKHEKARHSERARPQGCQRQQHRSFHGKWPSLAPKQHGKRCKASLQTKRSENCEFSCSNARLETRSSDLGQLRRAAQRNHGTHVDQI